ncbi:MAG: hypothetical protein MI976_05780 [Pseudomonadales bacterium]|nr:hypothetical protein [Pseudomonadales bacterium]
MRAVSVIAVSTLVMSLFSGCRDSRVDALQTQLEALEVIVQDQAVGLATLQSQQANHQAQFNQIAADANLHFKVDNIEFEIVEKAFEPIVMGQAELEVVGSKKPELIFVEWSLILAEDKSAIEPVSYIQRVHNGVAQLRFAQPLPRHGIKKEKLTLQVKPTGWYQGHVPNLQP